MKYLSLPLMLFFFLFSGCLVSEITEYKLKLNDDGKSGTLTIILHNLQSDATGSEGQEHDFDELMKNWKSDQYLLDQMNKGAYVKERKVAVKRGTLVWTENLLFSDVSKLFPEFAWDDTVRIPFKDAEAVVVETNGKITKEKDKIIVWWEPNTRYFELQTKLREFKPASNFLKRFHAYTKKSK